MTTAPVPTSAPRTTAGMSRGMTLLFAVAGGAAVGNLYWSQPLLATIADTFGISTGTAGLAVTLTQIGYALGVFLIVPLGDTVNRKRVIPAVMILAALALLGTGLAPTFSVLLATLALVGVSTVTGQLLTPLAGDLAADDQRGRVLGTVASGIMLGLLISRSISGLVADVLGWRSIYFIAAGIMLVFAIVLAIRLPAIPKRAAVPYGQLLASVVKTLFGNRTIQITVLIGATAMFSFTLFWTGLTLLLTSDAYSFSTGQIGLVSLFGIAGAVSAQGMGRVFDRGLAVPFLGVGLAVTIAALVLGALGQNLLVLVIVAITVFSIGVQGVLVLSQTRMLSIDPTARSRMNTVFVVTGFIAGAIGSAVAGPLWQLGGWTALMVAAGVVVAFGLLVWALNRRGVLAPRP